MQIPPYNSKVQFHRTIHSIVQKRKFHRSIAISPYKNAIKQSGYKDNLIFSETQAKNKSRKRKSYGSTRLLTAMLPTISEKSF